MDDFAHAQIDALKRRVEDLERHLRTVYEHLGLDASAIAPARAEVDPALAAMLRDGHMVQAIKHYAGVHGVDLMSAKVAIERIHSQGGY